MGGNRIICKVNSLPQNWPKAAGDMSVRLAHQGRLSPCHICDIFCNLFAFVFNLYTMGKMHANVLGLSWTDFTKCLILLFFLWKKRLLWMPEECQSFLMDKHFVLLCYCIACQAAVLTGDVNACWKKKRQCFICFNTQAIVGIFQWFSKKKGILVFHFILAPNGPNYRAFFVCFCTTHFTMFPKSIQAFKI